MKQTENKSVLKIVLGTFMLLLALSIASCQKEDTAPTVVASNADTDLSTISPKSVDCDTVNFKGRYKGVIYDVVIVIDRDNCTFSFEGDVTIDGTTYHIDGNGEIKVRNFKGTVTDADGNSIPLTDYWIDIIYNAIDLTGFMEQQIVNSLDMQ